MLLRLSYLPLGLALGAVLGQLALPMQVRPPVCDPALTRLMVLDAGPATCAEIAADVEEAATRLRPLFPDVDERLKKVFLRVREEEVWSFVETDVMGLAYPVLGGQLGFYLQVGRSRAALCHELAHACEDNLVRLLDHWHWTEDGNVDDCCWRFESDRVHPRGVGQ